MTTGELLSASSDVSNVAAIIHLQNLSVTQWTERLVAYDQLTFDFKKESFDIEIETNPNLEVDIIQEEFVIDIVTDDITLDIEQSTDNIDVTTCK